MFSPGVSACCLAAGGDGLDGVSTSTGRLDGYGGYLEGSLSGLFPGAVGFYLDHAVLAGLLPGAVSINLNDASIANALPGAVSSYLDDVAVGAW